MIFINHTEVLDGKVAIVDIKGPLNSKTSPDVESYINQLLQKEKYFILLNSAKLEYVSSEGIGLILLIQKKIAERNGSLILFNLPEEIRSLYALLGFDKIFRIAGSRIEAMQIMDKNLELRESQLEMPPRAETEQFREEPPAPVSLHTDKEDQVSLFEEDQETHEFTPFIFECPHCSTMVRVRQSGNFLCPQCNREFSVNSDRSVTFNR